MEGSTFFCPGNKYEKTGDGHDDAEEEPEQECKKGVSHGEELTDNVSPEVEQHMQQYRVVDAAAFFTYISQNETGAESINSLHHIHMEGTEQDCLHQVCRPEGQTFFRLAHGDAPENQFLGNRTKQHRVKEHCSGDTAIETSAFQQFLVYLQPMRKQRRGKADNIRSKVLHAGNQKDDSEDGQGMEHGTGFGQIVAVVFHIVPQSEENDSHDRIAYHDIGVEIGCCPEIGQVVKDSEDICGLGGGVPGLFYETGNTHGKKDDQVLHSDCQQ